jgi:GTP pyrophosphokinase
MEWQQEVKDPKEFLKVVKVDLYPDEVYAYTPKGKILSLPKGATPIDFAYAIHTDIGHRCVGARVNGKLVPLKTQLVSGDRVEILTSPGHRPSRDWLKVVVTQRAKSKIRSYLSITEMHRSITLGKELCEREFKKYRLNFKELSADDEKIKRAIEILGFKSLEDFFAGVGLGKATAYQLISRIVDIDVLKQKEGKESTLKKVVRKAFGIGEKRVKVKGMGDVLVYLAKCCKPIMGEEIVGYITRGKGVSVHKLSCPNAERMNYAAERRIDVEWEWRSDALYEVGIIIRSDDKPGILAKVVSAVADEKTNIKNVDAKSLEGKKGETILVLDIHDKDHLDRIMKKISGISGVQSVERI